jgi:hypothetical protein
MTLMRRMLAMWLAFLTWLLGAWQEGFSHSHTKKVFLKNKINPTTFACEIPTERIPVGI